MMSKARKLLKAEPLTRYYLESRGFDFSTEILDPQYLEFYVHCHPTHSVGHLHIHCCLKNLRTANGRALSLMGKNMPLAQVIEALEPRGGGDGTAASTPLWQRMAMGLNKSGGGGGNGGSGKKSGAGGSVSPAGSRRYGTAIAAAASVLDDSLAGIADVEIDIRSDTSSPSSPRSQEQEVEVEEGR
eukprot:g488.t1